MAIQKSKIALTSIILGLFSIIFSFGVLPFLVRIQSLEFFSGIGMILGILSAIVGLITGIWGIFDTTINKKKGLVFAIIGLLASIVSILFYIFLIVAIATFN